MKHQSTTDNAFLYFAAFAVNLMSFGSGVGYGWTSPALPKLSSITNLDENPLLRPISLMESAWITSLFSLGATFGPFFAGFSSFKYGRKKTLLFFSLPMLCANIMLTFASSIEVIYLARFMLGLGTGCVFTVTPIYLAEISQVNNRGKISCFLGIVLTLGNLFAFALGPYVTIKTLGFFSIVPNLLFLVLFGFFIPESPYFLVLSNKILEAELALSKLRNRSNPTDIRKEVEEIIENIKSTEQNSSFALLFKPKGPRRAFLMVTGIFIFQQFSGIVGIMAYLQTIFDLSGSQISPEISCILVGLVQVVAQCATSLLIDRIGRKVLLLVSIFGVITSLTLLGLYFYLLKANFDVEYLFWLPIFSLMLYIVVFNLGFGPIPWTILGEVFPTNIKSLATTMTTTICLGLSFLVAMFLPSFMAEFGEAATFWILAFGCALGLLFIGLVVPETKGKSLQEIVNMLAK